MLPYIRTLWFRSLRCTKLWLFNAMVTLSLLYDAAVACMGPRLPMYTCICTNRASTTHDVLMDDMKQRLYATRDHSSWIDRKSHDVRSIIPDLKHHQSKPCCLNEWHLNLNRIREWDHATHRCWTGWTTLALTSRTRHHPMEQVKKTTQMTCWLANKIYSWFNLNHIGFMHLYIP